ncbi:hypothetical protein LCGC14_2940430 [marine sediment metagenome]|uniref:Uncharacterized protein n=1 Tax=marine sediment metagenome TaxID=412755 RepID=A0A0F8Y561_9ZZZZ
MAAYTLVDSFTESTSASIDLNVTFTKVAQIFTASETYTIARLGLHLGANPYPADVSGGIYSVSNGIPNNLLTAFTITVSNFLSSAQVEYAVLDTPIELDSGTQYAVVLDWISGAFQVGAGRFFDEDHYPGGEGLSYDSRIPEWGNPFGSGYLDLYFETYSSYSLTPTPAHEATGIVLFPTLSWTVD